MYKNLCVWALKGGQIPKDESEVKETIILAKSTGYDAVEIWIETMARLAQEKSIDYIKALFLEAKMIPAGWQIIDTWRGKEDEYQRLLKMLPLWAKTAQALDCKRAFIWIPNYSDERDYQKNFWWHVKRLSPIVSILKDYDVKFGIEWQGPKTLRIGHKYEFIRDMKGLLQLIKEIDGKNVGLLLDSFHWYTSYGTLDEIRNLKDKVEVFYVHINDAPKGIPVDEQVDDQREIPGATGMIDLVGFLKCLKDIGYNGPVEPTSIGSKVLADKPFEEAARVNCEALERLFQRIGV